MLIFDCFPANKAQEFANYVKSNLGKNAIVCESEDEARQHDVFPFAVTPPIVMVERNFNEDDWITKERRLVETAIAVYGGEFAGT
jgi:hypothetical protein